MGIVSALMGSPCVTPALVGTLSYIVQTGNIFLGGMALFTLAIGMGTPMLVIAIFGSHLLPKAGAWMTQVKNVTGILLMVLAGSIFFRAFPSEALDTPNTAKVCPQVFASVGSQSELKVALERAKKENQPVILDVYADWCVSCKQIDHEVFSNQHVLSSLQNAKLLRFDITKQTADQEKLKKELGIIGPPTVLFFNTNGEEAKAYRLVGKIESNDFINHFNSFLNVKK
jgi:thiol:disulfide interchange protein DsbD